MVLGPNPRIGKQRAKLVGPACLLLIFAGLFFDAKAAEPAHLLRDFGRVGVLIETSNGPCVFIDAYVATDGATRAQGLMYIESLGEFEGMLFIHRRPAEISMWMKNTLIALDMLFVRDDQTIARIVTDTVPLSTDIISSREAVTAVLELNAGSAQRWGIQIGDRVQR